MRAHTIPWPLQALTLIVPALLLGSVYRLSQYLASHVFPMVAQQDSFLLKILLLIFSIVTGGLAVALLGLALTILRYLARMQWSLKIPRQALPALVYVRWLSQGKGCRLRTFYIVAVAFTGTFYVILLQDSLLVTLCWSAVFPLLFCGVSFRQQKAGVVKSVLVLIALMTFCAFKITFQDTVHVMVGNMAETIIIVVAAVFSVFLSWRHIRKAYDGLSIMKCRLLFFLLSFMLFMMYFFTILATADSCPDRSKPVIYKAVITEKCPPYPPYQLQVLLKMGSGVACSLFVNSAAEFYSYHAGDEIAVEIHYGLFGWPWYNQNIPGRSHK